ncbi:MAG: hypothetical protein J7M39_04700 [Anaerolineae bacterium]|nr:hypothetical protein [Anaerolineae bacterium]
MELSETDRGPLQRPDGADSAMSNARQDSALERYRMYGRFSERYWSKLFGIAEADLTRFATQMRESGRAVTLTDLARDVIRARLQAGSQLSSEPAPSGDMSSWIVRQWDPGVNWREGDRVMVVVASSLQGRPHRPCVGEVIHVEDDGVAVNIDGIAEPQLFALGPGAQSRESEAKEAEMLGLGQRFDEDAQIDFVLWRYGSRAVGRLLYALDADSRFVELEGLWFLRELTVLPSGSMLARLAETMFEQNTGPVRLDDVVAVLSLAGTAPPAARFGLAQALGERTGLFENIGSAARPVWTLAGPPPLVFTARHAVYDPETYVVLCVPGETLSVKVAQQLWRVGLLRAALGRASDQVVDAGTTRGPGSALPSAEKQSSPSIDVPVTAASADETAVRRRRRWRLFSRG